MEELLSKQERLVGVLRDMRRVAVAYSGGLDSSYLLKVAHDTLGGGALAVTVRTAATPYQEYEQAQAFCTSRGIAFLTADMDIFTIDGFASNPSDRCFLCKKKMMQSIIGLARVRGFSSVADGSNTDDERDYRPGQAALDQLGIVSPLREAGLAKPEIRELSRRLELPTWDKPPMACLVTRIPYGQRITAERLARIRKAESCLLAMGLGQVRVRDHGDTARIETDGNGIRILLEPDARACVNDKLKMLGYAFVSVDLQGYRTGSMDRPQCFTLANQG